MNVDTVFDEVGCRGFGGPHDEGKGGVIRRGCVDSK